MPNLQVVQLMYETTGWTRTLAYDFLWDLLIDDRSKTKLVDKSTLNF